MATTLSQCLQDDRVGQLQLGQPFRVEPDVSIEDVVAQMTSLHVGYALVMSGDELLGIFTERDFVSRVVAGTGNPGGDVRRPIREVMTPTPLSVPADASLFEAIELMEAHGFRHIPVKPRPDLHPHPTLPQNGGAVTGVLSVKDVVHYLVGYFPANVYNLPPRPTENQAEREGA